jgi:hypothetical protein
MTKLIANALTNSFTGSRVVARGQATRHGDANKCIIAHVSLRMCHSTAHGCHAGGT